MKKYFNLTKIIAIITFLNKTHSYRFSKYHLNTHFNTYVKENSGSPGSIIPADEEVVRKLEEKHKDEINRYLHPIESGLSPKISDQELEETFGKPLTPENISKRQQQQKRINPYDLPDTSPTNKLPYFVNLEFPNISKSSKQFTQSTKENNVQDNIQSSECKIEKDKPKELDKADLRRVSGGLPMNLEAKDPLRELIDRNEPYPEFDVKYGPKWYLPEMNYELTELELEEGWIVLPCGRVFKRVLQPSLLKVRNRKKPVDETCVTFKFKLMEAKSNKKIAENRDLGGSMVTTYMNELSPVFRTCLKAMETGEQAEFVFHVSEYNPENEIVEDLLGVEWLRLWVNLWESHLPNERWWSIGPDDAHLYPEKPSDEGSKYERLEKETEQIASQIETEMCTNPASPYWSDVIHKLSSSQKESFVRHFDRQLERIQRMKHSEFIGSRAFGEQIKSTGQVSGYDVGQQVGGTSQSYCWRESPFNMYIAVPVINGVRSEHVRLNLTHNHLTLSINDITVIDSNLVGNIDLDTISVWAMSDSALSYQPLSRSDERLKDPIVKLGRLDEYDHVSKRPSILIFLKKNSSSKYIWGKPFTNS